MKVPLIFYSESTESPSDSETPSNSFEPRAIDMENHNQAAFESYDSLYSGPSRKMMEKMGYKKDKGLGKLGQGELSY